MTTRGIDRSPNPDRTGAEPQNTLALRTDAEAMGKFWQSRPEPGFHDIFGLVKIGRGRIDGDILCLVKNLRFFKEVLGIARAQEGVSA